MSATAEQLAKLAEPIPSSRVSQRQGNRLHQGDCDKAYKSAPCRLKHNNLDYITARVAMERLDDVVGPACWQDQYEDRTDGSVRGGIGILTSDAGWVWKWDVGVESDMEADKGSYSDAFKRAAVKWGIARELYPEVGRAMRLDAAGEQAAHHAPAPQPAIPTGPSTVSGTVAKGTGNGMDLLMRQGPDGSSFGFKLVDLEGHPRGKKSTGVRAFGAAAEELQRHADVLVGSKLIVSGPWRGESFTGKDGQKVAYDVLVLETAEGAGITIPADSVAPAAPVADAERDAELDALPW